MKALLVYPHQLFSRHPGLASAEAVYLVEDPLFFKQYAFHKRKLILHRASMKAYEAKLHQSNKRVRYIQHTELTRSEDLFGILRAERVTEGILCDVTDDWLERRVRRGAASHGISLSFLSSPAFLTAQEDAVRLATGDSKPFMAQFYRTQRKRLGILMDGVKPTGGKWSFDTENRSRLPRGLHPPARQALKHPASLHEAVSHVKACFPSNPGSADSDFEYPVTEEAAESCLSFFLEHHLDSYGLYQDAISQEGSYLFHSVLSPALNIGLLEPQKVVQRALERHRQRSVPLNALEGFIRQIIGWREFVRAVYLVHGRTQRTTNFFGFARPLPAGFWTGRVGLAPLDVVVQRVLDTAYANHIERLMLLSNFFLLCESNPDAVYEWFMALFIDAYDWVMVPNVYGMGLYADGGSMITKPYVSSSNYILKMSDFKKGEWSELWDALFWRFVHEQRPLFEANPRTQMMTKHLDRFGPQKMNAFIAQAERYLSM